jgi:U4/U6 small nuclear ribonucleoprotein PRP31
MRQIERMQQAGSVSSSASAAAAGAASDGAACDGVELQFEDTPDYGLVVSSNRLLQVAEEELQALHRYVAGAYGRRYPELESVVPAPAEYFRAVRAIGNATDVTEAAIAAQLQSMLPAAQVMLISVTVSTAGARLLPPDALADVLAACDEAAALLQAKRDLLAFIESRMGAVAANLSALVGPRVAALLVGIAGGIGALSRIPGCNIQVLGQRKKTLAGLNRAASCPHAGVVFECELVCSVPPGLRVRAAKVVAQKAALAARVDSFGERRGGDLGASFYREIAEKLRKWQEPPPGKSVKPLAAPDDVKSSKRGGARHRKMKERMGLTDVRREANRMGFGSTAAEYGDSAMGADTGMLGAGGGASGRLRMERREQKILKKRKLQAAIPGGMSGASAGAASSLAFTPLQGIQLADPAAQADRLRRANEQWQTAGYFAASAGFATSNDAGKR